MAEAGRAQNCLQERQGQERPNRCHQEAEQPTAPDLLLRAIP
jgi:hypothetical protein